MWIDYAPVGLTVNKQVGDVFTVNIYAEQSTTVDLQYSAVFSGDCPLGSYSLDTGVNSCELSVNSGFGNYIISVNDNVVTLNIVSEPSLIVVTNVEKLFERFPYEERGVEATLSQTYENSVSNSVVYDLSKYISGHPFNSFSNYNEHVDNLNMMDNSYTVEASEFIKEKCNGCSDIMILGDDYVIPGYRRIIDEYLTEWLWFNGVAVESVITTDIPYIEKEVLLFSEYFEIFRQGSGYQGKNVLVIHPANEDSSMSDSIEGLKTAFVDRGFDPDFTDISGDTIYCVDESWSSDASGKTLILIGSEEDNNAFSCLPFIQADLDNYSAAHLLPNVWDTDEFALVINTDDPAVIESFASMVREQQLENLGSETAYFFNMGTQYVGYGALVLGAGLIIAGTGGAAAPAGLILIGGIANVAADSTDVANTCYVNYDSMGWCGGTIALAAIPVLPSKPVKAFIRQIKDFNFNQIVNLQLVDDVMKKSIKYFQPDDLKNVIKNEETLELFSDGKHFLIGGDDITSIKVAEFNNIKKEHLAEGFVNLKRLDLDNAYLDPDWLTQLRMQGGNPGFWAELKHASDQIDNFDKVIVGKRHVGLNIDMDVLLKKEGVQEAILDEVKNYNSLLEIEEFNLGDDLYKQLTARIGSIGTTVEVAGDTLTITNVRLIVRENTPIGPNLQTFLDENPSMELIRFRGVDWP